MWSNEIGKNCYIKGFEKVGIYEIIGYHIQADDNWGGARGTQVILEYGDVEILPDKERPTITF